MKQIVGLVLILCCTQIVAQEVFPDGKAIPEWFITYLSFYTYLLLINTLH